MPFPPDDGGKLCVFGLIDYLREFHNIHIILSAYSETDLDIINRLQNTWPDVNVHRVMLFKPLFSAINPPKRQRAIKKIKNIYRFFFNKTQAANPVINTSIYSEVTKTTPFFPHEPLLVTKVAEVIAATKFDIIQTELTRMLNLVHLFPAYAKKVFVQIEGRADVLYDYGISTGIDPVYVDYVTANTSILEYTYMGRYDAVFALNETDKIKLEEGLPASVKVYYSPYGILDVDIKPLVFDDYNIENLIFVGGENHFPNVDALDWFLTKVILEFKNKPFKKLYVTGNWSVPTMTRLSQLSPIVEFVGFVDDLQHYLKTSVSIVPIRIGGGGIRTKILSAMANGSPVVSTSLAAIGIRAADKKQLLIADTAGDFAASVNRYFTDKSFARSVSESAYELIKNEYSQSVVGQIRNNIYNKILN